MDTLEETTQASAIYEPKAAHFQGVYLEYKGFFGRPAGIRVLFDLVQPACQEICITTAGQLKNVGIATYSNGDARKNIGIYI